MSRASSCTSRRSNAVTSTRTATGVAAQSSALIPGGGAVSCIIMCCLSPTRRYDNSLSPPERLHNTSIYYRNSDGTNWSGWTLWAPGYKQVSSFMTDDILDTYDGGHLLLLGTTTSYLSTERFNNTTYWDPIVQQDPGQWISVAGAHFDDSGDPSYEHNVHDDDCRVQNRTYLVDPYNPTQAFTTDGINWAEVMYNEARGETVGAQALVGWTVRNRAYKALRSPSQCGTYPGAQSGGALTSMCRGTVPCSDPNFCDDSRRVCCVIHGGQTQLGISGNQFNDEHVDMATLSIEGFLERMWHLSEGRLLDMSNPGWKPDGISGCPQTPQCGTVTSGGPLCSSGFNVTGVPNTGPMEFLSYDYCAQLPPNSPRQLSDCKRYNGDRCGNNDSNVNGDPVEVLPGGACAQTNPLADRDNFFWNRVNP